MSKTIKEISVPTWWKPGGGMMYKRDCLGSNHPEHPYNYVVREYGVDPEDFGIKKPIGEKTKCPNCGCEF
jgi:hypothetical protein